ncbi:selenocysteine-specific translation elongation factor [Collinsella sp. BIOML-A4]|uniref:selenocysteine-specific translation elongation factor n=1 Tax=unclassified Collinsella TaxID=2637548 RepID=UPI00136CCE18|nr:MULTISPECIES: selenocysteine-specific translation elongation factor [unclassified Collinsella]MZJ33746.1 selenocysteine-specific translation elongation factor [Collinsella sp. BIOML-A1]MZJ27909.1 selenocysteine-specific translation elongation factor [Collinsella sp. BIOML-A2]MZJ29908.1 selenocysteine-specific translation elongation factor [Collinsella sp. BIOML-A3]MZJ97489.1 selenocysteine-specific translation elongation factor [Collinsella sp. BIOML-A6]MZK31343.1 selenocysteine-specific tr
MSEVQALVECPVIVGTAGHVDHGKSALIEALTGKNPDRLEVERRRGMTVELGFGELALPSGKIVGLVDVPGHAHYLRAMVQGATGIDVAVLVVSAVEGVMPQTREHVHVLELLGVTHMVIALTMCDLADSEMIELAELDVDDFLSDTVFADAPMVSVSSKTGAGIDDLLAALDEQVAACWDACRTRAELTDGTPRLPIDRCFTIKGVGTVVTGTLHDAPVAVGDELMTLPSRTVCRVRGIQVHGDTQQALPGQRVALNLVGDGVAALDRGEMLGVTGHFGQTMRFMMTFTYLGREGAKPRMLESGARVHVMAGTAEVVGRIMLLEGEAPMAVGETRIVQVRLENSLPLRAGDHAVVLSYSPVMLIGGGCVLLSRCRRSRELSTGERTLLAALEAGDIAGGVGAWLALQTLPVVVADVAAALDLVSGEADAALNELVARGVACKLAGSDGTLYANSAMLDAAMDALAMTLTAMHAAAPKETGFTPGAVAHAAWPAADEGVAAALIAEGCSRGVCAAEGAEVFDPHSAAAAARAVHEACDRIVALLDGAGLDAPTLPEVGERLQLDRDIMTRALRELSLNRSIVKVERDVALSVAAETHARELVAAAIEAAGGAATTSVLREALGVSRKRAISILEHLDAVRFTVLDKEAGGLRSLR